MIRKFAAISKIALAICLSFSLSFGPLLPYSFAINPAGITKVSLGQALTVNPPKIETKLRDFPLLSGVEIDSRFPEQVTFYLDQIEQKSVSQKDINQALKYFLGFLALPREKLWVNLSPYEKTRVAPDELSNLDIGKDLLLEDYLLKQFTASLTNPKTKEGKKFWQKVYKAAQSIAGTTKVPIDTCYKVWIVPDTAEVYEYTSSQNPKSQIPDPKQRSTICDIRHTKLITFVKDAKLKVMIEEDYHNNLKINNNVKQPGKGLISHVPNRHNLRIQKINAEAKEIFKQELLPIIERQVNKSINFAPLRQMYYALILADYCKNHFKNYPLYAGYVNQEQTVTIKLKEKDIKNRIFKQYVVSLNQGVYSFKKEARKYFSGGFSVPQTWHSIPVAVTLSSLEALKIRGRNIARIVTRFSPNAFPEKVNPAPGFLFFSGPGKAVFSVIIWIKKVWGRGGWQPREKVVLQEPDYSFLSWQQGQEVSKKELKKEAREFFRMYVSKRDNPQSLREFFRRYEDEFVEFALILGKLSYQRFFTNNFFHFVRGMGEQWMLDFWRGKNSVFSLIRKCADQPIKTPDSLPGDYVQALLFNLLEFKTAVRDEWFSLYWQDVYELARREQNILKVFLQLRKTQELLGQDWLGHHLTGLKAISKSMQGGIVSFLEQLCFLCKVEGREEAVNQEILGWINSHWGDLVEILSQQPENIVNGLLAAFVALREQFPEVVAFARKLGEVKAAFYQLLSQAQNQAVVVYSEIVPCLNLIGNGGVPEWLFAALPGMLEFSQGQRLAPIALREFYQYLIPLLNSLAITGEYSLTRISQASVSLGDKLSLFLKQAEEKGVKREEVFSYAAALSRQLFSGYRCAYLEYTKEYVEQITSQEKDSRSLKAISQFLEEVSYKYFELSLAGENLRLISRVIWQTLVPQKMLSMISSLNVSLEKSGGQLIALRFAENVLDVFDQQAARIRVKLKTALLNAQREGVQSDIFYEALDGVAGRHLSLDTFDGWEQYLLFYIKESREHQQELIIGLKQVADILNHYNRWSLQCLKNFRKFSEYSSGKSWVIFRYALPVLLQQPSVLSDPNLRIRDLAPILGEAASSRFAEFVFPGFLYFEKAFRENQYAINQVVSYCNVILDDFSRVAKDAQDKEVSLDDLNSGYRIFSQYLRLNGTTGICALGEQLISLAQDSQARKVSPREVLSALIPLKPIFSLANVASLGRCVADLLSFCRDTPFPGQRLQSAFGIWADTFFRQEEKAWAGIRWFETFVKAQKAKENAWFIFAYVLPCLSIFLPYSSLGQTTGLANIEARRSELLDFVSISIADASEEMLLEFARDFFTRENIVDPEAAQERVLKFFGQRTESIEEAKRLQQFGEQEEERLKERAKRQGVVDKIREIIPDLTPGQMRLFVTAAALAAPGEKGKCFTYATERIVQKELLLNKGQIIRSDLDQETLKILDIQRIIEDYVYQDAREMPVWQVRARMGSLALEFEKEISTYAGTMLNGVRMYPIEEGIELYRVLSLFGQAHDIREVKEKLGSVILSRIVPGTRFSDVWKGEEEVVGKHKDYVVLKRKGLRQGTELPNLELMQRIMKGGFFIEPYTQAVVDALSKRERRQVDAHCEVLTRKLGEEFIFFNWQVVISAFQQDFQAIRVPLEEVVNQVDSFCEQLYQFMDHFLALEITAEQKENFWQSVFILSGLSQGQRVDFLHGLEKFYRCLGQEGFVRNLDKIIELLLYAQAGSVDLLKVIDAFMAGSLENRNWVIKKLSILVEREQGFLRYPREAVTFSFDFFAGMSDEELAFWQPRLVENFGGFNDSLRDVWQNLVGMKKSVGLARLRERSAFLTQGAQVAKATGFSVARQYQEVLPELIGCQIPLSLLENDIFTEGMIRFGQSCANLEDKFSEEEIMFIYKSLAEVWQKGLLLWQGAPVEDFLSFAQTWMNVFVKFKRQGVPMEIVDKHFLIFTPVFLDSSIERMRVKMLVCMEIFIRLNQQAKEQAIPADEFFSYYFRLLEELKTQNVSSDVLRQHLLSLGQNLLAFLSPQNQQSQREEVFSVYLETLESLSAVFEDNSLYGELIIPFSFNLLQWGMTLQRWDVPLRTAYYPLIQLSLLYQEGEANEILSAMERVFKIIVSLRENLVERELNLLEGLAGFTVFMEFLVAQGFSLEELNRDLPEFAGNIVVTMQRLEEGVDIDYRNFISAQVSLFVLLPLEERVPLEGRIPAIELINKNLIAMIQRAISLGVNPMDLVSLNIDLLRRTVYDYPEVTQESKRVFYYHRIGDFLEALTQAWSINLAREMLDEVKEFIPILGENLVSDIFKELRKPQEETQGLVRELFSAEHRADADISLALIETFCVQVGAYLDRQATERGANNLVAEEHLYHHYAGLLRRQNHTQQQWSALINSLEQKVLAAVLTRRGNLLAQLPEYNRAAPTLLPEQRQEIVRQVIEAYRLSAEVLQRLGENTRAATDLQFANKLEEITTAPPQRPAQRPKVQVRQENSLPQQLRLTGQLKAQVDTFLQQAAQDNRAVTEEELALYQRALQAEERLLQFYQQQEHNQEAVNQTRQRAMIYRQLAEGRSQQRTFARIATDCFTQESFYIAEYLFTRIINLGENQRDARLHQSYAQTLEAIAQGYHRQQPAVCLQYQEHAAREFTHAGLWYMRNACFREAANSWHLAAAQFAQFAQEQEGTRGEHYLRETVNAYQEEMNCLRQVRRHEQVAQVWEEMAQLYIALSARYQERVTRSAFEARVNYLNQAIFAYENAQNSYSHYGRQRHELRCLQAAYRVEKTIVPLRQQLAQVEQRGQRFRSFFSFPALPSFVNPFGGIDLSNFGQKQLLGSLEAQVTKKPLYYQIVSIKPIDSLENVTR